MKKLPIVFDYLPYCKPCLACCKNENLYLSESEKMVYGQKVNTENCHHLLEDGRCNIHANRPVECQIYPLDLKRLNGIITWILWNSCPATTSMIEDYISQQVSEYETKLTPEWVCEYVLHHETNEPEKYASMSYQIIKPYNEVE